MINKLSITVLISLAMSTTSCGLSDKRVNHYSLNRVVYLQNSFVKSLNHKSRIRSKFIDNFEKELGKESKHSAQLLRVVNLTRGINKELWEYYRDLEQIVKNSKSQKNYTILKQDIGKIEEYFLGKEKGFAYSMLQKINKFINSLNVECSLNQALIPQQIGETETVKVWFKNATYLEAVTILRQLELLILEKEERALYKIRRNALRELKNKKQVK